MDCLSPRFVQIIPHKDVPWCVKKDGSPADKVLFLSNDVVWDKAYNPKYEVINIPCGSCEACLEARAKDWANRLTVEMSTFPPEQCWFVTLTIDNDHISEYESGKTVKRYEPSVQDYIEQDCYSLHKEDPSIFMKRLRTYLSRHSDIVSVDKVRFFACGEYGDTTYRPHYHLIIMGVNLFTDSTLRQIGRSDCGDPLYTSGVLLNLWPKGFNSVAPASWETAKYVTSYVTKKMYKSRKNEYEKYNLVPEFAVMSRRPGIGHDFFESHADSIKLNDGFFVPGRCFKSPVDRYASTVLLRDLDKEAQKIVKDERRQKALVSASERQKITSYRVDSFLPKYYWTGSSYQQYVDEAQIKSDSKSKKRTFRQF